MNEEIQLLLELQGTDRECSELESQAKRLQARAARLERDLEEERAAVQAARQRLAELERASRLKNLEVDELDVHTRQYQKRLDEAIISFKEMEALRTKIASERDRMNAQEDEALAMMDAIDAARVDLSLAGERLVEQTARLMKEAEQVDREADQVRQAIAARLAERAHIAARTRPHLLARYENLRTEFPDPVVLITNGSCSGCKLRVSGNTVERARNASDVITCENCSRILHVG